MQSDTVTVTITTTTTHTVPRGQLADIQRDMDNGIAGASAYGALLKGHAHRVATYNHDDRSVEFNDR